MEDLKNGRVSVFLSAVASWGRHPAGVLALALAAALAAAPVRAQQDSPAPATVQPSATHRFDIASQPLTSALVQFSNVTGLQFFFGAAVARDLQSSGVVGTFTAQEALRRLLAGTGLLHRFTNPTTVTLQAAPATGSTGGGGTTLDPITVDGTRGAGGQGYVARRGGTGTKTDTPLIETPQSISVVTRDQLRTTKPASVTEALAYTPGVSGQSPAFSRMVDDIMIRGFNVATGNFGILLDGMKLQSNVYDGGIEPYGLERIEVLRGASSMLYGQLGPGGVVNAISKLPTATPLHEINLEYGSYDRKQISADFGGPIGSDGTWSYRLTGLWRDADNWVHHVPDDKRFIAPALTFRPSESTSLTVLGSLQQVRTKFAPPMPYADLRRGRIPRDLFIGEPGYDRYESDVYTAGYLFEHRFNDTFKLRHNVRYFHADVRWDYLVYGALRNDSSLTRTASDRREKSTGLTADTSLESTFATGPLHHTLLSGIDVYRRAYNSHRYRGTVAPLNNVNNPVYGRTPPVVNFNQDRGSDNTSLQVGFYVQDQIKVFDQWVLLLGGRFDWTDGESKSYLTRNTTHQKDQAVTGRAGLVYLFESGIAPYASVSQSFAPTLGTTRNGAAFKPTKGLQYEAGVRYQPPGSTLLLSGAVYDLTQTNVTTVDPADPTFLVQTGKVRSRGVELEARAKLGNVNLIAAYTYTDARILKSNEPNMRGHAPDLVPAHTASLWADYTLDDLGLKGLKVGAGVRYVSAANIAGYPNNVPGRTLVDALVSYDLGALGPRLDGVSLALNARNLFDKKYMTCAGADGCRYGDPRTVVATLSYRW